MTKWGIKITNENCKFELVEFNKKLNQSCKLKIMSVKKLVLLVSLCGILFLFFITASYLYVNSSKIFVQNQKPEFLPLANKLTNTPDGESGPTNVLLLGYGGSGHDGALLTDTIIVMSVNKESKKVLFTSIPRDLWVLDMKVNNAHASGGGPLAKAIASKVIGMPVDYFVSVDFQGFIDIVDTLGGLDVTVPVTFDDYFYPVKGLENETCSFTPEEIQKFHEDYTGFDLEKQFTCRYEHLHFDAGKNHMDGVTALKFVRSRHSETQGGDFARSQRQHQVLLAVKSKILSLNALSKSSALIDKLTVSVKTDIDKEMLLKLIGLKLDPDDFIITTLYLSTDNVLQSTTSTNGQYILIPKAGSDNFSETRKLVNESL